MNSCGFRRAEALLLGKARWNMNGKFELNDAVIYGSHGLCTLCEIAEKDFGGAARAYYVLRPAYSGSSVFYVPVDSEVLTAKMRRVKSAAELRALLGAAEDEDAWIEDDRARQNHLRQVLDGGDTKALLATLRSLYRRRVSLVGPAAPRHRETAARRALALLCAGARGSVPAAFRESRAL